MLQCGAAFEYCGRPSTNTLNETNPFPHCVLLFVYVCGLEMCKLVFFYDGLPISLLYNIQVQFGGVVCGSGWLSLALGLVSWFDLIPRLCFDVWFFLWISLNGYSWREPFNLWYCPYISNDESVNEQLKARNCGCGEWNNVRIDVEWVFVC